MDELLKELERTGHLTSSISFFDVATALCLSFALSLVIAWVYRATHQGVSYSQQYVHTLILMGTVVALIMLIIGSNVARAFALVGALSIIRFRNAVKETRDVGFIFLAMALGMAVGTRFYLLAIYSTATLSAFMMALTRFNLFAKEITERILRIQFPVDRDYERAFEAPFRAHLDQQRVISIETVRAGVLQEVVLSVVLKKSSTPSALLEAVRGCNDNNKVSLIIGQQAVDL
jgi:uncharacterized membrane protein YhiD involved in acid resistance